MNKELSRRDRSSKMNSPSKRSSWGLLRKVILAIAVLVLTVAVYHCASVWIPIQDARMDGIIVGFQAEPTFYDLRNGRSVVFRQWSRGFHPEFYSVGRGDTLILGSSLPVDPSDPRFPENRRFLFKWLPIEDTIVEIQELGTRGFWYREMDYVSDVELYIYYGYQFDTLGIYWLDKEFQLVRKQNIPEEIVPFYDHIDDLFGLGDYRFVVSCNDNAYIIVDSLSKIVCNNCALKARSSDYSLLLYTTYSSEGEYLGAHLYDVATGSKRDIDIEREIMSVGFSPDNRFLVYSHLDWLKWSWLLRVYDLTSGEDKSTGFASIGDLWWINTPVQTDSVFSAD